MEDRRKHPRKKVTCPIPVMDQDRETVLGHLVDISVSGFMLLTPVPLELGRVFQLSLQLPESCGGGSVALGAESLWREASHDPGTYWAGFQIIDISPDSRQRIQELLDEQL